MLRTYLRCSFSHLTLTDLEVPELREGVDDDAEDDVEADGRDEDEEWCVIDHQKTELGKCVLSRMTDQTLQQTLHLLNENISVKH